MYSGTIQEWDLVRLKPSASLDAAGGAIWCMEASPDHSMLAAGCEDGRVGGADVANQHCLSTCTCTCILLFFTS